MVKSTSRHLFYYRELQLTNFDHRTLSEQTSKQELRRINIYPQPIRNHYHPKYTLIMLAPVSYLRNLVVRAVHRHRTGVGSIPAGGPIVDDFFSAVPG